MRRFGKNAGVHLPAAGKTAASKSRGPGGVRLDSLDYILDPADCAMALRRAYKFLNPGGCLIFDVNTPEKLRAMDGQVFLDEDDDVYCVWRGEFDEETNICSYGMDLFQRRGELWERSFEEHQEYAYSEATLPGIPEGCRVHPHRSVCGSEAGTAGPGEQRIYFKARKGTIR